MKKYFLVLFLFVAVHLTRSEPATYHATSTTPTQAGPDQSPEFARQQWLERNGEIPEGDTDVRDWKLAQKTSWWGKPLDPQKFWSNRVVWDDKSAEDAAHRHGRGHPPIPTGFPSISASLPRYPDDDGIRRDMHDIGGPNIAYATSSRESSFWDVFGKTMPHPPEKIEREQCNIANSIYPRQYRMHHGKSVDTISQEDLQRFKQSDIRVARGFGCPAEALTDDALFWAYVAKQRQEYRSQLAANVSSDDFFLKRQVEQSGIDSRYINEPLTDIDLQKANVWKIAYLRRLRAEKVDSSYINAYSQAWNISFNQLNSERD